MGLYDVGLPGCEQSGNAWRGLWRKAPTPLPPPTKLSLDNIQPKIRANGLKIWKMVFDPSTTQSPTVGTLLWIACQLENYGTESKNNLLLYSSSRRCQFRHRCTEWQRIFLNIPSQHCHLLVHLERIIQSLVCHLYVYRAKTTYQKMKPKVIKSQINCL